MPAECGSESSGNKRRSCEKSVGNIRRDKKGNLPLLQSRTMPLRLQVGFKRRSNRKTTIPQT